MNKLENLLNDVEKQGWSIQEQFFSSSLITELNKTLLILHRQGELKQAGIGREKGFNIEQSIRSDKINWFDEESVSICQQDYLDVMNEIQENFNQHFYFGLKEFEVHFALYEPDTFYSRHLDQHKNQDTRVLTVITYLNENWQKQDGGELCLYLEDDKKIVVEPKAGTMVCFLSAEFEHEVLPARRERMSLTGWFRK